MECVVQKTTLPALQRFLKVPSAAATADDLSLAHADAGADDAHSGRGSHSGDPPTGEASQVMSCHSNPQCAMLGVNNMAVARYSPPREPSMWRGTSYSDSRTRFMSKCH